MLKTKSVPLLLYKEFNLKDFFYIDYLLLHAYMFLYRDRFFCLFGMEDTVMP